MPLKQQIRSVALAPSGPIEVGWTGPESFSLSPLVNRVRHSKIDAGVQCLSHVRPILDRFGVSSVKIWEDDEAPFTAVEFQFTWKGQTAFCVAGAWDLRDLAKDMVRMASEAVQDSPEAIERVIFKGMPRESVEGILGFLQDEGIRFQGARRGKQLALQPVLDM